MKPSCPFASHTATGIPAAGRRTPACPPPAPLDTAPGPTSLTAPRDVRYRPYRAPALLSVVAGLGLGSGLLGLGGCRPAASRGQTLLAGGLEHLALGDTAGALQVLESAT